MPDKIITRFADRDGTGTEHLGTVDDDNVGHTACGHEWYVPDSPSVQKRTFAKDLDSDNLPPEQARCGNCPWESVEQ